MLELILSYDIIALILFGRLLRKVETGVGKNILVSLKNVEKEFPSGEGVLKVLKGIDLDIFEKEFVVILGESGCGKSTLLNIIGGSSGNSVYCCCGFDQICI